MTKSSTTAPTNATRIVPALAPRGIGVAGMPAGSPGMEQGSVKEPYDVIAWRTTGSDTVYARH